MGRKKAKQITYYISAIDIRTGKLKAVGYNESYTNKKYCSLLSLYYKEETHKP